MDDLREEPLKPWIDKLKAAVPQTFMGVKKPASPTTPTVVGVGGEMEKPSAAAPQKSPSEKPKEPVKKWTSAGGVVIKSKDQADKVYIVKPTNNYGPWAFPKGRVDAGESLRQAAKREVFEETGLHAELLGSPKDVYLGKGVGSFSVTHFFLMVRTGGTPTPNEEMEEIKLVPWEKAKAFFRSAGNKRDIEIADRAVAKLKELGYKTGPE